MNSESASDHDPAALPTGIRFYLVDDDELFHLIHNRFIRQHLPQAEIISFMDPREALQVVAANSADQQPSVVLLDLNMPYMSGWEWLDAFGPVRVPNPNLRIFILSSSDSVQDRSRTQNYPFVSGYLVKPLTKESMLKVVGA